MRSPHDDQPHRAHRSLELAPTLYATSERDDARALVVIFLRGGADGLALIPPIDDDAYHTARPTIGIASRDAIRLDDRFGLHPRLAPLQPLFAAGQLGVVHAVGSDDSTRSHFEAQDHMEQGGTTAGGWLGRFLRARDASAPGALSAVAIGTELPQSLRGAPSAAVVRNLDDFSIGVERPQMRQAIAALYANEQGTLGSLLADASRDTVRALERSAAMQRESARPANGAEYPADEFGRGLADIARLIKGRVGLSVATIDLGGWDSHFTQGSVIEPLMDRLARGLAAFHTDLGASRMAQTTVVVMTEFGRRVAENASRGTDHGRGSVMLTLGAGAAGGRVRADWRGLASGLLEGPGDVPVTTDFRDVLAPILHLHGAPALSSVFPGRVSAATHG